MRVAAIVVASVALLVALPLVALVIWIFSSTIADDPATSGLFIVLAGFHLLFTGVAVLFACLTKRGLHMASLVMSVLSLLTTASSLLIGPALLFGLSGA